MWVLLVIITTLGLPPTTSKLESYYTLQECEQERIRITAEMDKVYTGDERNYTLECKPVKRLMEKK